MTREEIIAKIRKVEALFGGSEFTGEVNAAASALERLNAQLAAVPENKIEFKISLPDPWKRQLFLALARRHELYPYRQSRQRHATVMVRDTPSHMNQILWPEFLELSKLLHASTKPPGTSSPAASTATCQKPRITPACPARIYANCRRTMSST